VVFTCTQSWYRTFNDIRKLDYGSYIPSSNALMAMSATSIANFRLWATSDDMTAEDWCPGIGLDVMYSSTGSSTSTSDVGNIITDLCSVQALSSVQWEFLAAGRSLESLLANAGWLNGGFVGDLWQVGKSATLYFWAKTGDVQGNTAPRIAGLDTNRNFCFNIRGTTAWLTKHNMVSRYMKACKHGIGTDCPEGLGGDGFAEEFDANVTWMRWNDERMYLQAPDGADDALQPDTWIFFGLAIDIEERVVRFAVNGFVLEKALPEGEWGCDQLDIIFNSGQNVDISPVRVARFPLTAGSLQNMYLSSRKTFATGLTGEDTSRSDRMVLVQRPFQRFTKKMVALSPPILIQTRANALNSTAAECKGQVTEMFNQRKVAVKEKKCLPPYKCSSEVMEPIRCLSRDSPPPERFFGQELMEVRPGAYGFPEFAWTLEGGVIVRDGMQLSPSVDYIDDETLDVELVMVFYSPHTQVVTLFFSRFDLSGGKVKGKLSFQQINLMDSHKYFELIAWAIAGVCMAALSVILAIPAALRELSEWFQNDVKWLEENACKDGKKKPLTRLTNIRIYSTNTTQPDVFDVLLNLAMIFVLISFATNQKNNYIRASDIFADLASIDWGSDKSFQEKISAFMSNLGKAAEMAQTEQAFLNAAFYMLALCCMRCVHLLHSQAGRPFPMPRLPLSTPPIHPSAVVLPRFS